MRRCWWLVLLLWGTGAGAAELSLSPGRIVAGGLALLRFQGETPAAAEGLCHGKVFQLTPVADGAVTLVGADLDSAPGAYPVQVKLTDRHGRTRTLETVLQVTKGGYPEERLTLPEEMVTPSKPATLKRIDREQRLVKQLLARQSAGWPGADFAPPVPDAVGSPFGLRRILNGKARSPHGGIDFRSPNGRPVKAAAAGRVVFAGELYFTGTTVILDHGGGLFSLYAHLQASSCQVGQTLGKGALLGQVGSTGRSTGPHLHWGIRLRGDRIDPMALLGLGGERP